MLALALLSVLTAEPAKTAAVPWVAVFITPEDTVAEHVAGKLEVELAQRLEKKGAQLIDLTARFPQPKTSSDEGDQLLKEGKDAYDNLDMDTAIQKLTDGVLFFIRHPELADPKKLAEVFVFLGAAELQNGVKTSNKEFTRAIALDPDYKPDPKFFAADVQKAYAAARADLDKAKKGLVLLESVPAGAKLELDGKPLGLTPLPALELAPGRHHAKASRPGYVTAAKFPDVATGEELEVRLDLAPLPAYAASVDLAKRLANRNNFDAQVLPPQASQLGQQLQARFIVIGSVSTVKATNKVSAQVWDVETGDRLRELKFDGDEFGMDGAAETIKRWIDRPTAVVVVEGKANPLAETLRKPWLWAVVGVVVVGAAVGAGVAVGVEHHHPDFITTGIP
jgi:hypothetical protein